MAQRQWRLLPAPPPGFSRTLGVPPLWALLLYHRGITRPEEVEPFQQAGPHLLGDPFLLPGMTQAVARLQQAIQRQETVGVFGDFDADGVTATALLYQVLTQEGLRTIPYIPHRVEEGHGLNPGAIASLRDQGVSLVVTVDCGVSSNAEVALAKSYGMDTIITDHHVPPPTLPPALAIVNPRVPGARYPFLHLTGAGLAWKLAQGLAQATGKVLDPGLVELAALGTVADVAPLLEENRYLVREGIAQLRQTKRPGLLALYREAGVDAGRITAETIGFSLAPRLNAAGRLQRADPSLRLLTTTSPDEASGLAKELGEMNRRRRQLLDEQVEVALGLVHQQQEQSLLLVESEEFSPGVVGLVANRLVEEFTRPAVVVALEGEMARGSARSMAAFNITEALAACEELLERYGGHSQAAGFVARREHLPALRQRLQERAKAMLAGMDLAPTLEIEAQASPRALMGETWAFLRSLEPFGIGNPSPVFLARSVDVLEARRVGNKEQHLMLKVREGGAVWSAVAFNQGGQWQTGARKMDIVYALEEDTWANAGGLRLRVVDYRCR